MKFGLILSLSSLAGSVTFCIITLLINIGYVWTFALIFFGAQVTHDYTMGKNLIMTAATIVGMAIVMFIGILFTSLISNMVSFVTNIVVELQYRM